MNARYRAALCFDGLRFAVLSQGVLIGRAAAVDLVHVPYRGATQLATDLVAGEVSAGVSALSDFLGQHRAGKLRILATSAPERSLLLPAVLTFREQGFGSVTALGWHGVYAPAGTSQAIIQKYSAELVALLQAPDLRAQFMSLGLQPTGTTPQVLATIMAADIARWRPIIEASGFTAE